MLSAAFWTALRGEEHAVTESDLNDLLIEDSGYLREDFGRKAYMKSMCNDSQLEESINSPESTGGRFGGDLYITKYSLA